MKLEDLTLELIGQTTRIVSTKDDATIIDGHGSRCVVTARFAQNDREMENATSDYNIEQLHGRKVRLVGGVAKILVGNATNFEAKQRKLRVEDALGATRAAVEDGLVSGGGIAMLRAAASCRSSGLSHDEAADYEIIKRACRSPLRWIAANAGYPGSVDVHHVLDDVKGIWDFNAAKRVYEDMMQAGVIDATKVTRSALENAASATAMLLTSGPVIADVTRKEESDG